MLCYFMMKNSITTPLPPPAAARDPRAVPGRPRRRGIGPSSASSAPTDSSNRRRPTAATGAGSRNKSIASPSLCCRLLQGHDAHRPQHRGGGGRGGGGGAAFSRGGGGVTRQVGHRRSTMVVVGGQEPGGVRAPRARLFIASTRSSVSTTSFIEGQLRGSPARQPSVSCAAWNACFC